jgi:hypothetical protein
MTPVLSVGLCRSAFSAGIIRPDLLPGPHENPPVRQPASREEDCLSPSLSPQKDDSSRQESHLILFLPSASLPLPFPSIHPLFLTSTFGFLDRLKVLVGLGRPGRGGSFLDSKLGSSRFACFRSVVWKLSIVFLSPPTLVSARRRLGQPTIRSSPELRSDSD